MNILTINLLFSTIVFWVAARIYVLPKLSELTPQTVLLPILLLHSFRHLGLMFLSPGATYAGIPAQFAYPAAFGDLLAALLALAAIPAVVRGIRGDRLLGSDRGDRTGDGLWGISLYGTGLLDTCLLGSCSLSDALHHVRGASEALDQSDYAVATLDGDGEYGLM
ncbi:MAG TPA: hypothetical protein VFB56_05280 [Nitrospiraceae bacterium]|nr:hypothetical protein [Nitrospiraceae bacterium]